MFVIGALVLFATYNFLFKPQRADLAEARDNVAATAQKVNDAKRILSAPIVQPSGATIDATSVAVPDHAELAAVLRQLQASADDAGVALISVDPAPLEVNPRGAGGSVLLTIAASGTDASVLGYLELLRDLERVLVVEQVAIDAQPEQPTQLSVSARVFTREAPAAASEPTIAGPSAASGS
ncbi:MAG TPA: hypothetical protein VH761_03195 [Ilumatobacteraceae bacterium]